MAAPRQDTGTIGEIPPSKCARSIQRQPVVGDFRPHDGEPVQPRRRCRRSPPSRYGRHVRNRSGPSATSQLSTGSPPACLAAPRPPSARKTSRGRAASGSEEPDQGEDCPCRRARKRPSSTTRLAITLARRPRPRRQGDIERRRQHAVGNRQGNDQQGDQEQILARAVGARQREPAEQGIEPA